MMGRDTKLNRYLGDGVYIGMNPYGQVVLTTEDGIRATNTIFLEPEVADSLIRYINDVYRPVLRGDKKFPADGEPGADEV